MTRRLTLAIGCLACATSAVSAAPFRATPAEPHEVAARTAAPRIVPPVRTAGPLSGVSAAGADRTLSQPPNHPAQDLLKTYLIYQKNGRPLRVEAETIGFVRDGVVVLHNPEGQAIAVIPVTETGGIIEERAVLSSDEPAPKAKAKAPAKTEAT